MIVPVGKTRLQINQGGFRNESIFAHDMFQKISQANPGLQINPKEPETAVDPTLQDATNQGVLGKRLNTPPPEEMESPDLGPVGNNPSSVQPAGGGMTPYVGGVKEQDNEQTGTPDIATQSDTKILQLQQQIEQMGAAFVYGELKDGEIFAGWSIGQPIMNAQQVVDQIRKKILEVFRGMGYKMSGTYSAKDPSTNAPVAGYKFKIPTLQVTKKGK